MDAKRINTFLKFFINTIVGVFVILNLAGFLGFMNDSSYHFGDNEEAFPFDWIYKTSNNYLTYTILNLIIGVLTLFLGYYRKEKLFFISGVLIIAWFSFSFFISKLN